LHEQATGIERPECSPDPTHSQSFDTNHFSADEIGKISVKSSQPCSLQSIHAEEICEPTTLRRLFDKADAKIATKKSRLSENFAKCPHTTCLYVFFRHRKQLLAASAHVRLGNLGEIPSAAPVNSPHLNCAFPKNKQEIENGKSLEVYPF
jgi:hypothetical protein